MKISPEARSYSTVDHSHGEVAGGRADAIDLQLINANLYNWKHESSTTPTPPTEVSVTARNEVVDIEGAVAEESGITCSLKFGVGASELKIIDVSALEVSSEDDENISVSILGEDQVLSKDVKYLVIGQSKELDADGVPKLAQLAVKEGDTALGRDASPDFLLADNVSRNHATLRVDSEGALHVIDHSMNGTTVEYAKSAESVAEDSLKKDGAAVLKASGVVPPRSSARPATAVGSPEPTPGSSLSERIDVAVKPHLQKKHYQARELKEVRKAERESAKLVAEANILNAETALKNAKGNRAMARLTHNRFTQYLRKHELRGQYERETKDRIEHGDLKNLSRRTQKKYLKASRELAKNDARTERVQARTHANAEVFRARGDISRFKAEKRDLSRWSRKGARNTYFENRAIVRGRGGFSVGEVSPDGMTAEQKKRLEERMKARLHTTRTTAHKTRGRVSTREGARAPR
jgi:hypothetical protein